MRSFGLLLFVAAVAAYSSGEGTTCNTDDPGLGVIHMPWTHPPFFNGEYSIRTGDVHPSRDASSYVPDEWTTIHVRALRMDRKYCGLLLYAEDINGRQVGEWWIPTELPRKFWAPVINGTACQGKAVHHAGAEEKRYHHFFKWKAPAGTGPVTFKALVKQGPTNTGEFYYPNANGHLTLSEAAARPPTWIESNVGESCTAACTRVGQTCDLAGLSVADSPTQARYAFERINHCEFPIMSGCSEYSPSRDAKGRCTFAERHCALAGRAQPEPSCDAVAPGTETRFCACTSDGSTYQGLDESRVEAGGEEVYAEDQEDTGMAEAELMMTIGVIVGAVAMCCCFLLVAAVIAKKATGGSSSASGYDANPVAAPKHEAEDMW
jgi:hypothetical protein